VPEHNYCYPHLLLCCERKLKPRRFLVFLAALSLKLAQPHQSERKWGQEECTAAAAAFFFRKVGRLWPILILQRELCELRERQQWWQQQT
jgi:hypothetical protein